MGNKFARYGARRLHKWNDAAALIPITSFFFVVLGYVCVTVCAYMCGAVAMEKQGDSRDGDIDYARPPYHAQWCRDTTCHALNCSQYEEIVIHKKLHRKLKHGGTKRCAAT